MTFNNSTLSGLLQNINHEKTKFITMLYKIKKLLEINDHDGYMLIRSQTNKLMVTENVLRIYENAKFGHPVIKIFYEYLVKTSKCVNGAEYFVKIVRRVVDEVLELLDNGVGAKRISNELRSVKYELEDTETLYGIKTLVNSVLKNVKLTKLLCEAAEEVGDFDSEKIRIIKASTGMFGDSYLVDGLVLPNSPKGNVKKLQNTSIGIFDCSLDLKCTELKGTVLMKNAEQLLAYSVDETERIKKVVDGICVNVMVVNGNVNNQFLDFCNERHIMVLPVFNKFDLVRISKALNCPIQTRLDNKNLNYAKVQEVTCVKEGNKSFTKIVGGKKMKTLVLKHSLSEVLDEFEDKIGSLLTNLKSRDVRINRKKIVVTSSGVVGEAIKKCLIQNVFMLDADRERCFKYSLEFLATVLEVGDYLMVQKEQLDLKAPPKYVHEDH